MVFHHLTWNKIHLEMHAGAEGLQQPADPQFLARYHCRTHAREQELQRRLLG
jgi:hypothetical protein